MKKVEIFVGYALGGAALGAMTGAILVWLLQKPAVSLKAESAESPTVSVG